MKREDRRERERQRADALRPLLEEQGLTYRAAGNLLGLSACSVAGLAYRNGIKTVSAYSSPTKKGINNMSRVARPPKPKRPPVTTFVPLAAPEPEAFTPKPGAWDALPGSTPVGLMQRTGCAWVIGERPFLFCNEPLDGHDHWCPAHVKLGTRPVVPGTPKRVAPKAERLRGMTS